MAAYVICSSMGAQVSDCRYNVEKFGNRDEKGEGKKRTVISYIDDSELFGGCLRIEVWRGGLKDCLGEGGGGDAGDAGDVVGRHYVFGFV